MPTALSVYILARPESRNVEPIYQLDAVPGFILSTESNKMVSGVKKLILRNSGAPF